MKRTRRASPELMMKSEHFLNVGYQKILTFERPGGGFDWWGNGPALVWLTAYGVQQLTALSKVQDIDTGVLQRAHQFLQTKQDNDGSWGVVGGTHGETISRVSNPRFALTAYVVWSLANADFKDESVARACRYLREHASEAKGDPYLLALAANALLSYDEKDSVGMQLLLQLDSGKVEQDGSVYWKTSGQTASCAYGDAADVEVTALAVLAMLNAPGYATTVNKALQYIVQSRTSYGTWGSTQATILALQCLVSAETLKTKGGDATIAVWINGEQATTWQISDDNRDVMQIAELGKYLRSGENKVKFAVTGNPNVMYQLVTRHYQPWREIPIPQRPVIELDVSYDRKTLARHDTIAATATLRYNGEQPTYMVIVDLGIPPGFSLDPGDFAEMMGEGTVKRYSITGAQVTLYLGDVVPGQKFTFRYQLKAKYPLKAKTPKSVAYEYYSPQVRSEAKPVELEVAE